jgi:hypothetical protein
MSADRRSDAPDVRWSRSTNPAGNVLEHMWVHEHTAETAAGPEAVWQVLRDLDQWASWDTSMEWVRLQGPFRSAPRSP